jgi:osmotically-inducible protein OsmY
MTSSKFLSTLCLGVLLSASIASANAQDQMNGQPPNADNSSVNMRDRNNAEPTADHAGNNLSDRQIMSNIRKAIVNDPSLSTYGQNVKVIAENGHVTLKGPVHGYAERKKIERKASQVVGATNVTDEMSVKGVSNR